MGSLMSGWDSHVPHPNLVLYNRNKSLTRGEIEAFWKSRKQTEEEHLNDIYLLSPRAKKNILEEGDEVGETLGVEKVIQKTGWWVGSKSAFLNEAPVIESEGSRQRYAAYASQFHVGHTASSSSTAPTGIDE